VERLYECLTKLVLCCLCCLHSVSQQLLELAVMDTLVGMQTADQYLGMNGGAGFLSTGTSTST
jgi:hypothetical protein